MIVDNESFIRYYPEVKKTPQKEYPVQKIGAGLALIAMLKAISARGDSNILHTVASSKAA